MLLRLDMCACICTANPKTNGPQIPRETHRHADVGAAVQEQRLRAPVARPGGVQVHQQRHQQRAPGRAVCVVAVPGLCMAQSSQT